MTKETLIKVNEEKLATNLPFEIVAVPQCDDLHLMHSTENTTPINVKIRVRNKEETVNKHGIISLPKLNTHNSGKNVRIVNSDQTILSFNFFTEADTSKRDQKKFHKNIFHVFKRGSTRNKNNGKTSYSPIRLDDSDKTKCSMVITDDQNDIINGNVPLKKNFSLNSSTGVTPRTPRLFIGKCKPGGCLDPPFNEDYYTYEPKIKQSTGSLINETFPDFDSKKDDTVNASNGYTNALSTTVGVESKSKDENIKINPNNDFDADIHMHSLITYPPTSVSSEKIRKGSEMKFKSRISIEDKARLSVSEFSATYFMPPKKERPTIEKNESNFKSVNKIQYKSKAENNILYNQDQAQTPKNEQDKKILRTSTPPENEDALSQYDRKSTKENVISTEFLIPATIILAQNDKIKTFESKQEKSSLEDIKTNDYKILDKSDVQLNESKKHGESKKEDNTILQTKKEKEDIIRDLNKMSIDNNNNQSQVPKEQVRSFKVTQKSIRTKEIEKIEIKDENNYQFRERFDNNLHVSQKSSEAIENSIAELDAKTIGISQPILSEQQGTPKENMLLVVEKKPIMESEIHSMIKKEISDSDILTIGEILIPEKLEQTLKDIHKSLEINEIKSSDVGKIANIYLKASTENIEQKDFMESNQYDVLSMKEYSYSSNKTDDYREFPNIIEIKASSLPKKEVNNTNEIFQKKSFDSEVIISKEIKHLNKKSKESFKEQLKKIYDTDILKLPSVLSKELQNIQIFEKHNTKDSIKLEKHENDINSIKDVSSLTDTDFNYVKKTPTLTLSMPSFSKKEDIISISNDEKTIIEIEESMDVPSIMRVQSEFNPEPKNTFEEKSPSILFDNKDLVLISENKSLTLERIRDSFSPQTSQQMLRKSSKNSKTTSLTDDGRDVPTIDSKIILNELGLDNSKVNGKKLSRMSNILKNSSNGDIFEPVAPASTAIDLKFHCYLNDDNTLIVKTLDPTISYDDLRGNISIIKSTIRKNDDEIRVPINLDTDLTIQIKKAKESTELPGFQGNITDYSTEITTQKEMLLQEALNSVYQNLIPLQDIIIGLKEEANILSGQQKSFKNILCAMENKPVRLIQTEPRCSCILEDNY